MDHNRYPSGILTFLFSDIQGSTPLWERDPAGMREALELHNSALHTAIEAHQGQVFKIIGDEFQAVFEAPVNAVNAAVSAQRTLANISWGRIGPLYVRMGIHTGHAVAVDDDYEVSHTFNRTARIMSAGHGGQILISVDVVDQIEGILPENVSLQDMGRQQMKGMTLREHIYQVIYDRAAVDFPPLKTEKARPDDRPEAETRPSDVAEQLQISLLGGFSLRNRDRALTIATPSHQALLAYLVIFPQRSHTRQQLAYRFWPDSTEAQARTNLRKALYALRHTLPDVDNLLAADRQQIQWHRDGPCVVDAWQFESAITQADQTDSPGAKQSCLERAVNAYHGDFMPDHYDDWVLAAREKLRLQYLNSLEKLLVLHEEQRQYASAISLARKLLREDPLHEAAYRRLMRLQSLRGDVAGAIRTYHTCSTRLQRELGVNPSQATKELYESLLQVETAPQPLAPGVLPLVAREEAWQALKSAWRQCRYEKPGVVLIRGEAGIGKTRLAEELWDWAERQGIVALTAVCYASERQLAYAPVAKWLRNDAVQPVYGRVDKRCLLECSRLLPELQSQYPNLPAPSPLSESWQRQHFFSALAQTLLQLRQPFLLFIDDLQWCDQDTLDWLIFLLHYDPQSQFLLLGTARSEEITSDHPLLQWRSQLDRDGRLTLLDLGRLDVENSATLARHILKQPLDSEQADRLFNETEGNPLFVVELALAGLFDPAAAQSSPLPRKVQAVIETRLSSLSQAANELAQLAAVIGHSFTFSLLNKAGTQSEDSIINSLDELWQRRIVRERDAEAYDFTHEKIRQGAYQSLSPIRRRQLHLRVKQAIEELFVDNLDPVSGQIATHCESAGMYQEAVVYYAAAAQAARAVYANKDVVNYLHRAIALFAEAETASQQQLEIHEQLGDVLMTIGHYQEAEVAYSKATSLAVNGWDLTRLLQSIADANQLRRNFDHALQSLGAADKALGNMPQDEEEKWWREWLNIRLKRLDIYYFTGQIEAMIPLNEEIKPTIEMMGTARQHAYYYRGLARIGYGQERYVVSDETVRYAAAAYAAVKDTDDLELLASCRFALGFAHFFSGWQGDLDEAEYHLLGTLDLAEQMGDVLLRARCLNYLALLYRRSGNVEQVAKLLPRAMSAAAEGNLQEYVANIEANQAWLKWQEGKLADAKKHGQHALEIWQTLPIASPLQWTALWPLIAIALSESEIAYAVDYAQMLLVRTQTRLPDELLSVIGDAIAANESNESESTRNSLLHALEMAKRLKQL